MWASPSRRGRQLGAVSGDDAVRLQPTDPGGDRGFRQAHPGAKLGHRDPSVMGKHVENVPVDSVEWERSGHPFRLLFRRDVGAKPTM